MTINAVDKTAISNRSIQRTHRQHIFSPLCAMGGPLATCEDVNFPLAPSSSGILIGRLHQCGVRILCRGGGQTKCRSDWPQHPPLAMDLFEGTTYSPTLELRLSSLHGVGTGRHMTMWGTFAATTSFHAKRKEELEPLTLSSLHVQH